MDYLIAIFIVSEHYHQSIMNFCLKTLDKSKTSTCEVTSEVPNVNCHLKIIPLSAAHKSKIIAHGHLEQWMFYCACSYITNAICNSL